MIALDIIVEKNRLSHDVSFQDHPRGPITLSLQAHLDKAQSAETEVPKMQGE